MKWLRRNVWRLLALAASVALALGFVPEAHSALSSLLTRLSPLLSLFGVVCYAKRKAWIVNPVTRFFAGLILDAKSEK